MNSEELINAIKNAPANDSDVDEACYRRLERIAEEDEIALELLRIVRRILNI